jgi:small subunit ribosomal protein S17
MAKTIIGIVSSSKSDKTIVVTVQTRKTHPLYRKQYSVSSKFMAHDEKNEAEVGDKVSIVETRPLSARKRHILDKIIEKPILREDTLSLTKVEESAKARHEVEAKAEDDAASDADEAKAKEKLS